MNPKVAIGIGALLVVTTLVTLLWSRWRPDAAPLFPKQRLRAWWTMVVVFSLATVGGPNVTIAGFALLSVVALREFLMHLPRPAGRGMLTLCYLLVLIQYWWVHIDWYGMFVIFIPVFVFLYLPTTRSLRRQEKTRMSDQSMLHWGLMTTVFCLSHAAYLMILPRGPGLLFFVTMVTEVADAIRILLSRSERGRMLSPVLSALAALLCSAILGPTLTPLLFEHLVLAGLVLGVAGSLGHINISSVCEELDLKPGGGLSRIESLAYTAPLFFHGYRYFYTT